MLARPLASPALAATGRLIALGADGSPRSDSAAAGDLAADLCHVGLYPVAPHESDRDLLDDAERARAERIARPAARARFAFAHATLRRVLGAYLEADPVALRFTRRPCRECGRPDVKPALAEGDVEFSLSHCDGAVAVAVGRRPVGVDVEQAARPARGGGRLLPVEREWLATLPPEARGRAFLELWTRKEARGKATGHGVWHALAEWDARDSAPGDRFLVRSLPAGEELVAAVAVDRA